MSVPRSIRVGTSGSGYEQVRAPSEDGETYHALLHHRVILYARGRLESVWFSEDAREVHHLETVPWVNGDEDLEPLSPAEHREVDPGRARISTPWDDLERGGEA